MANRIGYLAEEYSLLPGNHFGGLKRKSTIDALEPFKKRSIKLKKILFLVTFDVKESFNGVAPEVLSLHFRQNRVPE